MLLEAASGGALPAREALGKHIAVGYDRAVRDGAVEVINEPTIEVTEDQDDGPVSFDVVVEVRPKLDLKGYCRSGVGPTNCPNKRPSATICQRVLGDWASIPRSRGNNEVLFTRPSSNDLSRLPLQPAQLPSSVCRLAVPWGCAV